MKALVSILRPVCVSTTLTPGDISIVAAEIDISLSSLKLVNISAPGNSPCHIPINTVVFFAKSEPDATCPHSCSLLLELDHEAPAVQAAVEIAPWAFWNTQYPCRVRIVPEGHTHGDT
eukprot:CAMPEP_0176415360 /NCGR_PEP_ID=MMETSP0127-20121128/5765_1 /TAXON_ID=938130 /ORGANISM="Platyophrya macrostoma, Strain WH" /LENGTH=117 /DNA_ID=CAMNT_0017795351 /DNA_START=66 /DNA_END=415 /DNA_ORIENTATION=-